MIRRSADGLSGEVPAARLWSPLLALVPALIIASLAADLSIRPDIILVTGLALFGAAFAINSSVHSYLILAYAGSEKAAEDVGFYYAANAAGRFGGTLLSGLLYQWAGAHRLSRARPSCSPCASSPLWRCQCERTPSESGSSPRR